MRNSERETDQRGYFVYLRRRRRRGLLYRRFWLYPRLCRHLHGRVLDIGCGIGDMLQYRPQTIGVDVNTHTVAWCQSQGLNALAMAPDVLPFTNSAFDGALLDNVLEHLAVPQPLLMEIRRVLKPGGIVIAGVPGTRGYASDPDHQTFYDAKALISLLQSVGFRAERVMRMPFPISLLDRHLRQYCIYGVFRRE